MNHDQHDFELDELSYSRVENFNPETNEALAEAFGKIMSLIGEDVTREGLQRSPERVARAMQFLTHGY